MSETDTAERHAIRTRILAELFAEAYNFDGSGGGDYVLMLYDLCDESGIPREQSNTAKQAGWTLSEPAHESE